MKALERVLSILLVVCMIFTSQAFVTFADCMENTETIVNETTIEETTVEESDLVGESLVSAEEESESTESEDGSLSSPAQGEVEPEEIGVEDTKETLVEEPEEDEIETETAETTVVESDETVGESEDSVGASSTSAEEESESTESEEGSLSSPVQGEAETEETTIGESDLVGASEDTVGESEDNVGASSTSADKIEVELESVAGKDFDNKNYGSYITISVSRSPKLDYYVGDYFDPTALCLSVNHDGLYYVEVEYVGNEDKFQFWIESTGEDLKNTPFGNAGTIEVGLMYTEGSNSDKTYFNVSVEDACRIKYNKNLPSGYDISGGKSWYEDSTSKDPASNPIIISGSEDMTCENSDTKTRKLLRWNTAPDGSGTDYAFGDSINDPSIFTPNVPLNLYAVWSEPDNFFYVVYYGDDAGYAQGNNYLSEMHIRASAGAEAITDDMFSRFNNLSAAEPRGFYRVKRSYGAHEYATTLAEAKEFYHRDMATTADYTISALRGAYTDWVSGGATSDTFYGVLFNSYTYGFCYEGTQAKLTKFKYNEDIDDYLNLVKNNPPSGQKFVKWQSWYPDDVILGPSGYYDYSDDGQLDVYINIKDRITGAHIQYKDDDGIKELFDGWKDAPHYNIHFGAIYKYETYSVTYDQNLPSGYNLSSGKTWYADSASGDLSGSPIVLSGSADMTCIDANHNVCRLEGWNTKEDLTGESFNFNSEIDDEKESLFTSGKLTLYAKWSDPVAPKVYTIHYIENLPSGYKYDVTAPEWPADDKAKLKNGETIMLNGSKKMTATHDDGSTAILQGWSKATAAADPEYDFNQVINSPDGLFEGDATEVNLYGVWHGGAAAPQFEIYNVGTEFASGVQLEYLRTDTALDSEVANGPRDTMDSSYVVFGYFEDDMDIEDKFTDTKRWSKEVCLGASGVDDIETVFSKWRNDKTAGDKDIFAYADYTFMLATKANRGAGTDDVCLEFSQFDRDYFASIIQHRDTEKYLKDDYGKFTLIDDYIQDVKNYEWISKYDPDTPGSLTAEDILDEFDAWAMNPFESVCYGATVGSSPIPVTVDSISVKTNPSKTEYISGETFDATGLVIEVAYSDGTKEERAYVNQKAVFKFNPTIMKVSGDVVVTYGGKKTTVAVTVNDPPAPSIDSISMSSLPRKTSYESGEYLNPAGLAIKITYDDGSTSVVEYNNTSKNNFSFDPSLNTRLTTLISSVKVTYSGKSTSFKISVSSGGGGTDSGGGGGGGSTDPIPSLQNQINAQNGLNIALNRNNNIPASSLLNNPTLYQSLMTYQENANAQKTNATDAHGNKGYGSWMRVPNTTTWYFCAGDFNNNAATAGFLNDGWFNLGWDGQDKWYYFDSNGVMKTGWHQEGNKIYYLQADFSDNWYGKLMTGQQMIGGQVYNFDSNGALIN